MMNPYVQEWIARERVRETLREVERRRLIAQMRKRSLRQRVAIRLGRLLIRGGQRLVRYSQPMSYGNPSRNGVASGC